jgi:hypothetical protein
MIARFIEVQNCSKSEQLKVDKLVQKADELGVVITSENCGNLNDVNNVIRIITLMIWCEFREKFAQYVERNGFDFNREDLQTNFEELRCGHYKCSYKHNDFDLDQFVDEISESNSNQVFKEVANYLGIKGK